MSTLFHVANDDLATTKKRTDLERSRLLELVRLRAAQLLGCTEAIESHARQLLHLGENMGRISQVYWWPESSLFSEKEQAALCLCETVIFHNNAEIVEVLISDVRRLLIQEEILGIVLAVSAQLDWSQSATRKTFAIRKAA